MSITCIVIITTFYYKRWKWISKWAYTTKHGVQCFYEEGATIYSQSDVEKDTEIILYKWNQWYRKVYNPVPAWQVLDLAKYTICIFIKESVFES